MRSGFARRRGAGDASAGGDASAPGLIAHAVHDGHRVAREMFGGPVTVLRERVVV